MGRPFVIEYDQTPDSSFLLCRICNTHIAKREEWIDLDDGPSLFKDAVNYVTDTLELRYEDHSLEEYNIRATVVKVYCVVCNKNLGRKVLQVDPPDNPLSIREGRFLLDLEKMRFWDGETMIDFGN